MFILINKREFEFFRNLFPDPFKEPVTYDTAVSDLRYENVIIREPRTDSFYINIWALQDDRFIKAEMRM